MTVLLESLLGREALGAALAPSQPAWLAEARQAAAAALAREGLPRAGTEAWKYTSLRALEQRGFAAGDPGASSRAVDAASFALPGIDGPRLVFVNGTWRDDFSRVECERGLSLATLATAHEDQLEPWRAALAREYRGAEAAFARLNTALAVDGPLVRVAPGARIAAPLHLVFVGAQAERDIVWHARTLVELGDGASLQVIEHHVGAGASGAAGLGNLVLQCRLGRGARLDLVQVQTAAADASLIRRSEHALADDAILTTHALEAGAQLNRHDFEVVLAGRGARVVSRGVFALRGRQHTDVHMDVRHDARDTASDVLWRGVADQRARGVFHGAITVAAGADGADANLSSKNLLLSPHAEIDTQPVLEIHADEVRAAHGATVGQLDERALFYLRSRGLSADAARNLLITAFCGAALADLPVHGLREPLDAALAARLPRIGEAA